MTNARKSSLTKGLSMLALAGLGGAFGFFVAKYGIGRTALDATLGVLTGWDLLLLPALMFMVLLVLESGHLLGGFTQGMRFLLLIVGPLKLARTADGLRLDWCFNLGTLGGLAAALPDPARPMTAQLRPMVAGGPLASLLLGRLYQLEELRARKAQLERRRSTRGRFTHAIQLRSATR